MKCELSDGRELVAEYEAVHLRHLPKEVDKAQVGKVWAQHSGGNAQFAMLDQQDRGMNLAQQSYAALMS